MLKKSLSHRIIVVMVTFASLLAQAQTMFACESMGGQARPVCCCDEPGAMSKRCGVDGACDERPAASMKAPGCCEVTYQQAPVAKATSSVAASLQVLALDAPRPPPIPVDVELAPVVPPTAGLRANRSLLLHTAGTDTYLSTNRLRI